MKNDFLTRRAKRQVIEYEAKRWPRRIPYEMDPSFGDYKKIILEALKLWSSNSCLSFYESAEVTDRIKFVKDPKINCSFVGAPPHIVKEELFKQTIIKLTVDGRNTGDAVHEIGHALGMTHSHQHPDRDNHLEINEDNVDLSREDLLLNYGKQHRGWTFGVPYDHGSVMAYSLFAGSKDKTRPVFSLKEPWYEHVPGGSLLPDAGVISSLTKPAFTDLLVLNLFYECADVCNEQLARNKVQKCQNGGFPNPKNCSKCVCPTGFHGADCSRANNGQCGEEIDVHNVGKDGLVKFDRTLSTRAYAECHYHIKAPKGKVIQFKVTGVKAPDCFRLCLFGYAEIKARDDLRLTGMRFCCKKDMKYFDKFHESESNLIVVSLYAAAYGKTWLTMKYKIVDKKKTDSGTDSSLIRHGSNFSNVSRSGSKREEKFDGKAPGKGGIKWKIWNRA